MTPTQIQSLDSTSLRIAVARAKGWYIEECDGSFIVSMGDYYDEVSHLTQIESLPNWPNDIAAVTKLLDEFPDWTLWKMGENHYEAVVRIDPLDNDTFFLAEDTTPEIAGCRAWLMAKNGEGR